MATVELVAERWSDNRVPTRYAQRSLTEALTYLAESDKSLSSPKALPRESAEARVHIQRASRAAKSLLVAMNVNDRAATSAPLTLLVLEREGLDRIIEKSGGQ
jgi:hypothetical protein